MRTKAIASKIDYVLNVPVSVTAGVAAVASAFPQLWPDRVALSLLLLAIIALANLRGLRGSGGLMARPVYGFLATFFVLIVVGIVRGVGAGPCVSIRRGCHGACPWTRSAQSCRLR